MTDLRLLDKRYLNDSTFKNLVDSFLAAINQQQTSFAEIREAALFAQLKSELANPRPVHFSSSLEYELLMRGYKKD